MIVWISKALALAIHDRQLAQHGGSSGVRDGGMLDSALARPQQLHAYGNPPPDLADLAASLAFGLARNHPFVDGNGRASRMLMNYQLMAAGFLPVSIAKEERLEYFETLEAYAVDGDLTPFAEMVASLEEQRLDEYLALEQQQGEIGHTL